METRQTKIAKMHAQLSRIFAREYKDSARSLDHAISYFLAIERIDSPQDSLSREMATVILGREPNQLDWDILPSTIDRYVREYSEAYDKEMEG
jgi:hypothetical protein